MRSSSRNQRHAAPWSLKEAPLYISIALKSRDDGGCHISYSGAVRKQAIRQDVGRRSGRWRPGKFGHCHRRRQGGAQGCLPGPGRGRGACGGSALGTTPCDISNSTTQAPSIANPDKTAAPTTNFRIRALPNRITPAAMCKGYHVPSGRSVTSFTVLGLRKIPAGSATCRCRTRGSATCRGRRTICRPR